MPKKKRVENTVTGLVAAAENVWTAFLDYGPVDDGRPEGDAFDVALDALSAATLEVKYTPESGYEPLLEILLCVRQTPGGRGRNACHYVGTTKERGWGFLVEVRARSKEEIVGKILLSHLASGNLPPRVTVRHVQDGET